jgi:hypothetical protein
LLTTIDRYSQPATIELMQLLASSEFKMLSVEELTLSTSGKWSSVHRLAWRGDGEQVDDNAAKVDAGAGPVGVNGTVVLKAMQIRTFALRVARLVTV